MTNAIHSWSLMYGDISTAIGVLLILWAFLAHVRDVYRFRQQRERDELRRAALARLEDAA